MSMSQQTYVTHRREDPRARKTDPETSLEAGLFAKERSDIRRSQILTLLRQNAGGLTTDQMCIIGRLRLVSISPVMVQLERDGLVVRSGTRPNPSTGRLATVWQAVNGPRLQIDPKMRGRKALISALKALNHDAKRFASDRASLQEAAQQVRLIISGLDREPVAEDSDDF
jgi:hypothetical protein